MTNDIAITVLPHQKKVFSKKGERLFSVLAENGFFVSADCGGNGKCGKCRVKLLSGKISGTEIDENGYFLSCKASLTSDLTIELIERKADKVEVDEVALLACDKVLAIDLGTTTLVVALVDKNSGKTIKKISRLNPQGVFGADVISRISAHKNGYGKELQSLVIGAINDMISELGCGDELDAVVVANTTMLHLFVGEDPSGIGEAPFIPAFIGERDYNGCELGLNAKKVKLLPSASAYIGSDVIAGAVATGLTNDKTQLLVDLGTNGELILATNGQFYAVSTAAGPCFEGAKIECGVGGIDGAINSVSFYSGEISFTTVGGYAPCGICGAGLIDAVAVMLETGIIDETGAFTDDYITALESKVKGDKFYICESVYISQKDIREVQTAKAAIAAGIETLMLEVGVSSVDNLYLAGGLGLYLNANSAAKIGLIPPKMLAETKAVGNSALDGAIASAMSDNALTSVREIATKVKVIELSSSIRFNELYVDKMFF
jgi:uncharacterized 2Fe-2S/4Fe-4S cluster protein (DUF4445 family)